jgi:hypothetical protein
MKHAGPDALDRLEPLLGEVRKIAALKERSRGVFYRSARAFLHFHEHGDAFFADMRVGNDFQRFETTTAAQRVAFLSALKRALAQ